MFNSMDSFDPLSESSILKWVEKTENVKIKTEIRDKTTKIFKFTTKEEDEIRRAFEI